MTTVESSNFHPPASYPRNSRSRLKKHTLLFRYLAEINIILGAWYIQWRIGHTLNFNALWLAVPLLIAEVYSYVGGLMFTVGLWRPLERQVRSLNALIPAIPEIQYPVIDIFITCYNEPVEIIEQTTLSALDLDYPVDKLRVYILDDGGSEVVKMMTRDISRRDRRSPKVQAHQTQIQNCLTQLRTEYDRIQHSTSNETSVSKLVNTEKQRLKDQIEQKEREMTLLDRCHYIARPKPLDRPHHAKAGNINYALFSGQCSGEFIVTLDTDHVLKPHFLKRVLPYFYTYDVQTGQYNGNRVAFVQTPQDFRNLPDGDPFGHHAHLFYGPIQQGKDGLNSAFYTGTNAILRRESLISVGIKQFSKEFAKDSKRLDEFDLIGAMSTYSITEDMNTAMRLHAHGWQSIYHNELMAYGLAPDDLGSTLKQRLRWAQGTIQVLVNENPLLMKGLSFWQRLQYFQTMYSYFSGFTTLIYLLCPILYSFTDIAPMSTDGISFSAHFLPVFVINRLTFITATWGIPAREIWRCEQNAIALFPLYIQAVVSVLTRRSLGFEVTPKQRQAGIFLKLVIPQLTIFSLTILAILWTVYRFATGTLPNPGIYLLNSAWGFYNLMLLWSIIRASVWQPESSQTPRLTYKKKHSKFKEKQKSVTKV